MIEIILLMGLTVVAVVVATVLATGLLITAGLIVALWVATKAQLLWENRLADILREKFPRFA